LVNVQFEVLINLLIFCAVDRGCDWFELLLLQSNCWFIWCK